MNITFLPLSESHFPLLLKWLEAPHVKAWWDKDVRWTKELIHARHADYVLGFKRLGDQVKPLNAFVISLDQESIGYIQYYNNHDFPPEQEYSIKEIPKSCAGLDFYVGEESYLGKGIGSKALEIFVDAHVLKVFNQVCVDPESSNTRAIATYEKAGFSRFLNFSKTILMIKRVTEFKSLAPSR